jgi:hypothetical protein
LWKATAELGRLQQRLMRRLTYGGLVLFALGVAWWLLAGFVDLVVVFDALGRGAVGAAGVAGGIVLLPLTYAVAPLYAALNWGDWMPLLLSAAGSSVLALIGGFMHRSRRPRVR